MTEKPIIWSIVLEPDYQCEWYVGEVWVEVAGHQWREDTVVDVDYTNFERRLAEQVNIIKSMFSTGNHETLFGF
jgi:hypothetical protein